MSSGYLNGVVNRIADQFAAHVRPPGPGKKPIAEAADYEAARSLLDILAFDGYVLVDLGAARRASLLLSRAVDAAEAARREAREQ